MRETEKYAKDVGWCFLNIKNVQFFFAKLKKKHKLKENLLNCAIIGKHLSFVIRKFSLHLIAN